MGTTRSAVDWVWLAMVLGMIHAAFSLYWAAGGNWLLGTVGEWTVELRESDPTTVALGLTVIGLAKAAAAVVPVLVAYGRLPGARF